MWLFVCSPYRNASVRLSAGLRAQVRRSRRAAYGCLISQTREIYVSSKLVGVGVPRSRNRVRIQSRIPMVAVSWPSLGPLAKSQCGCKSAFMAGQSHQGKGTKEKLFVFSILRASLLSVRNFANYGCHQPPSCADLYLQANSSPLKSNLPYFNGWRGG